MIGERKRFTREEAARLLEIDVFEGQRLELLDGDLIVKNRQSPAHATAIRHISAWLASCFAADRLRPQFPIELPDPDGNFSVPEPDYAVLKEWRQDYEKRHPWASELLLAVEVADTPPDVDLGRKAALYARHRVPEYWVLDLGRRLLVVHRQPDGTRYRLIRIFSEDELVSLENRSETVKVGDLLPDSAPTAQL